MDPLPQFKWQWCNQCQGLAYANGISAGPCPAGGTHNHVGSFNYFLPHDVSGNNPAFQGDWRWCNKCQGLAYAGNTSPGPCPAGGVHDHAGSFNYFLAFFSTPPAGANAGFQFNWRWCNKCQGLAYAGKEFPGPCPAGGSHDHSGSYDYALIFSWLDLGPSPATDTQDNWQWCNKCQVLAYAGNDSPGACAGGGGHNHTGTYDYVLSYSPLVEPSNYQGNWQWCTKCQALAYAGNASPGPCPAGGIHDHTGSYNYGVGNFGFGTGTLNRFQQGGWQWCNKCECLSWTVNALGPCPAGGAHDHSGSYNYFADFIAT